LISAHFKPSLTAAAISRDGREYAAMLLHELILRNGGVATGVLLGQPGQPLGIGKRNRSQEHSVNDAEHRRVDANAERHRQHCDGRKARTLPQHAYRVPELLRNSLDKRKSAHADLSVLLSAPSNHEGAQSREAPAGRLN
jgi:hypothetical protein